MSVTNHSVKLPKYVIASQVDVDLSDVICAPRAPLARISIYLNRLPVFRYSTTLTLRDTDAAGVAFFAAYFAIAHDAYEAFLMGQGARLRDWLGEVHLPIVHSSADYTAPVQLGDAFDVELSCERLGQRSFTLQYHFVDRQRDLTLARLKTVHVAVKPSERGHSSVALPEQVRSIMDMLQTSPSDNSDVSQATRSQS